MLSYFTLVMFTLCTHQSMSFPTLRPGDIFILLITSVPLFRWHQTMAKTFELFHAMHIFPRMQMVWSFSGHCVPVYTVFLCLLLFLGIQTYFSIFLTVILNRCSITFNNYKVNNNIRGGSFPIFACVMPYIRWV